jgi:hypothetical protein
LQYSASRSENSVQKSDCAMTVTPKPRFALRPIHFGVCGFLAIGVFGRFALMSRGYNYDFESFQIVIAANQKGVAAWQTNRYNYGPIWWYLLRLFDMIHSQFGIGIRYQIVGLLTIADLFIAYFVYRFKGLLYGTLFFLNPISIIISGFHNQFDNVAIALTCLVVLNYKKVQSKRIEHVDFIVILLLGLSLATKHVFVFFVIWIAIRQKSVTRSILYLFGPFLLFGMSFVPYLFSSWNSIKLNVIEYRSFNNAPLWKLIGIYDGKQNELATVLFIILVLLIGIALRKIELENSLFFYCIVIVAFSPGISNQYLAIATIGAIGLFNWAFAMYFIYGAFWLAISPYGLLLARESRWIGSILFKEPGLHSFIKYGYQPFPVLLILGVTVYVLKSKIDFRTRPHNRNA